MEYLQHKTVFLPSDVRIAGFRIGRVTLGHIRLLELVESPFLLGGEWGAEDVAIALILLSRPWRMGLKRLRSPKWFSLRVSVAMRLHDCGADTAEAVFALLNRAQWAPERFVEDGKDVGRAFECATGISVRIATRAARVPFSRLFHTEKGAWDCVWDVPIDAVMLYCVAQEEAAGAQFMNPEEARMAKEIENGGKQSTD